MHREDGTREEEKTHLALLLEGCLESLLVDLVPLERPLKLALLPPQLALDVGVARNDEQLVVLLGELGEPCVGRRLGRGESVGLELGDAVRERVALLAHGRELVLEVEDTLLQGRVGARGRGGAHHLDGRDGSGRKSL